MLKSKPDEQIMYIIIILVFTFYAMQNISTLIMVIKLFLYVINIFVIIPSVLLVTMQGLIYNLSNRKVNPYKIIMKWITCY